jgi:glycosyltransferase involved in cell wall biosynthesis
LLGIQYPKILAKKALFLRVEKKSRTSTLSEIKISVIIPNLHSPIINQTLESINAQQTDIPYEIIVIGKDKFGFVEEYPMVKFIDTGQPVGASTARNIGIQQAKGEWLFFIDSDCIAQPGWLSNFANAMNEGWKIIGGGVITPEKPFWRLVYNLSMFHGELASREEKVRKFMPTLNLAVHKEVIENVGLMDENLPRGQDIDWTSRMTLAGYELLFKPSAVVEHLPEREDFKTLRDFVFKSGYYMIRVRRRYPEIFKTPALLQRPIVWRLLGPVIALYITLKIFFQSKEVRHHLKILPYVYLQKLSWCYGAAKSLKERED